MAKQYQVIGYSQEKTFVSKIVWSQSPQSAIREQAPKIIARAGMIDPIRFEALPY